MKEMSGADTDEQVMRFFTDRLKLLKAVAKMNTTGAVKKLKKFCEEARARMTVKTERKTGERSGLKKQKPARRKEGIASNRA